MEDIDYDEIKAIKEEDRHKELKKYLGEIVTAINNDNGDKELAKAIEKQAENVGKLVKAIQDMPKEEKQETPEIKVEVNQEIVISSIGKIAKEIIESNDKVIAALENRLLPDTFTLNRGYSGQTDSVKVNYKSAKDINKNKK